LKAACLLLSLAAVTACTRPTQDTPLPDSKLAKQLLSLSEEARERLDAKVVPAGEVADDLSSLRHQARTSVGDRKGIEAVAALNRFLFEEGGFVREIEDTGIHTMLLPWVLQHRRGSCLGLAGLYLVLARDLDLPVYGMMVPKHFFLRLKAKTKHLNIELLRKGEAMPEDWYREKWPFAGEPDAYLRTLTDEETLAVFHFNLGNALREAGNVAGAIRHYQEAVKLFDTFAEAHASLGLAWQIRKDTQRARQAYLRAKELHPDLPGLEKNLQVLEEERE
jgi:regulator of sirC expression with transglutaminase-like and TPR domain